MSAPLQPGFIALHGNQLEQLRNAVFTWCRNHPLAPLEQEIILVQSNGVAEWLKIALAEERGICASTQITLPGRFLWQAYRGMLGGQQVARRSPLDKSTLTWRLMRLLPVLPEQCAYAPLRRFLGDGDAERRLQLAQRLADLYDQYQVYRADWLADWADNRDVLRSPTGSAVALTADQVWQAMLWRALLASVPDADRTGRAQIHQQFLDAALAATTPIGRLPRRVIVFGIAALPYQTLQALGALATRMQVILAVPNPCRYYWGDIIDGRELLRASHRRHASRGAVDLATIPLEELHAHSHPLLAAWGRMGRDFIRMLDEFDDAEATRTRFSNLRIDLFSEGEAPHLLGQVQAAIRDLLPLTEHPHRPPAAGDDSIVFHVAHSVQREVEILHDQLLILFAPPTAVHEVPIRPRDIVVMVPDIAMFSGAIEAVFGQTGRFDERYIPYAIGDIAERRINPLLVALDWLLKLPQQRCMQSDLRDLLDVPALATRFGVRATDLPRLAQWIAGAGVRWGLDVAHRESLGLGAAGFQNAWLFGIQRMLLGYANGGEAPYADIEPYAEVGGLDAALAGALASLVDKLITWRTLLESPATPDVWSDRLRQLLATFFKASDERDRLTLAQLEQRLQAWLDDCSAAEFDQCLPITVVREAWLGAIDEALLNQRFVSGGVTFCSLMPMRAVPFRVVCLLGMNDGDYPRRTTSADFDLLALPGQTRPGDRSRRDDDRYLMLEALLSARDKLYISWVGRNVRDNSSLPPSVLVAQLRDYLQSGWQLDLSAHTTEHPLQPFSRRYFEAGGLTTYAREWRVAHREADDGSPAATLPAQIRDPGYQFSLAELGRFLRQPVKYFFRQRLQVVFDGGERVSDDEEPFGLDGLTHYGIARTLLDDSDAQELRTDVPQHLQARTARLAREGVLPIGLVGERWQTQLIDELTPVRRAWLDLCSRYPQPCDKYALMLSQEQDRLKDWLDQLRTDGNTLVWIALEAGKVTSGDKPALRPEKLIDAWLRQLAAAALGLSVTGYLIARDVIVTLLPIAPETAEATLLTLIRHWQAGCDQPLPTACKTALAWLDGKNAATTYDGDYNRDGEVRERCLARLWEDFSALADEPKWQQWSTALYGPLLAWIQSDASFTLHVKESLTQARFDNGVTAVEGMSA